MKTQEIPSQEWIHFCEQFAIANEGSLLTIQQTTGGAKKEIARDLPLQKMFLDKSGACNDVISITVGNPGKKSLTHLMVEPIHLKMRHTAEGNKTLQIDAENGTTLIKFHSGRFPEIATPAKPETLAVNH